MAQYASLLRPTVYVPLGDQPRRRILDLALQPLEERAEVQPRRDRIEDLDDDRSGIAQELAARPIQAGIERDRHAGNAKLGVEARDAELVGRLGPGRPPRALREDDD